MDLLGQLALEALFRPLLSEIYRFLHVRSFCQVVKESHNLEGNVSVNFPRLTHKRFQLEIHSEQERHARKVSFQLFARFVRSRSSLLESIHQIKRIITVHWLFSRGSTTKNPPIGSDGLSSRPVKRFSPDTLRFGVERNFRWQFTMIHQRWVCTTSQSKQSNHQNMFRDKYTQKAA